MAALLIVSPRFFPQYLPLDIRRQRNLRMKIYQVIPVTGRIDCVCFMGTGSVSFYSCYKLECETRRTALKEKGFFFPTVLWRRNPEEIGLQIMWERPRTFLDERSLQTKDRGRKTRAS